jgi:hypothetical protein
MPKNPKKLSDTTRSERRRFAKRLQMSKRQQRWLDVCRVVEAALAILNETEDVRIKTEFISLIRKINKYVSHKQSDEQMVFNVVKSGAWLISEIADETGFPTVYIQKLLSTLCREQKIRRENNHYKPV